MKNYKKGKLFLGAILLASLFGVMTVGISSMKNTSEVSAHPSNSLLINGTSPIDPNFDFSIPRDAQNKTLEPALITGGKYQDYYQDTTQISNLTKDFIYGYSSPVRDIPYKSFRTSNGKIITLRYSSNNSIVAPIIEVSNITLLDEDGNVEKMEWLVDEPTWGNGLPDGDATYSAPKAFFDNNDGTYSVIFSNPYGTVIYRRIDENLNILLNETLDTNGFSMDGQGIYGSSVDFLGNKFIIPDVYNNMPYRERINTIKISMDGKYEEKNQLESLNPKYINYENRLGYAPLSWHEAIYSDSLIQNDYSDFIGIDIFNNRDTFTIDFFSLVVWDGSTGNVKYVYEPNNRNGQSVLQFQRDISTSSEYYFTEITPDASYLKKLNTDTLVLETILTLPVNTEINFAKSTGNTMSFYGYIENFTGVFQGYGSSSAMVVGKFTNSYDIIYLNTIASDVPISLNHFVEMDSGRVYIDGQIDGEGFVDAVPAVNGVSDGSWTTKQESRMTENLLFGFLAMTDDYSPVLKVGDSFNMNIDDSDFSSQEVIDNYLIHGNKLGTKDNDRSVLVYDKFDIEDSFGGYDQQWLDNRINRNPLDTTLPIDWLALGIDTTKTGGYNVTYFVSDSQQQVTSNSKTINVLSDSTIQTDRGFLDAKNFTVDEATAKALTSNDLRDRTKYAELTAWSKTNPEDDLAILADHPETDGVRIGTTAEWAAINAGTPGRYPITVDLTYGTTPETMTVYCFITEESNVIGDYIFYVKDFEMPWDISTSITSERFVKDYKGNFEVYGIYKLSTGDPIDDTNNDFELRAVVAPLNATDPDPDDYTARESTAVSLEVWTKGASPTKEVGTPTDPSDPKYGCTPKVEVYYRVEDVKLWLVDWDFDPLTTVVGSALEQNAIDLENQIVGKTTPIKNNGTVKTSVANVVSAGYELDKYYLDDKATELTEEPLKIVYKGDNTPYVYYVRFKGVLQLSSVPTKIDFKLQGVNLANTIRVNDPTVNGDLIIADTRVGSNNNWTLKAELTKVLSSQDGSVKLPNAIKYKRSGEEEFSLNTQPQVLATSDAGSFGTTNVSDSWGNTKEADGFKFEAESVSVYKLDTYTATIKYSVSDTYEP